MSRRPPPTEPPDLIRRFIDLLDDRHEHIHAELDAPLSVTEIEAFNAQLSAARARFAPSHAGYLPRELAAGATRRDWEVAMFRMGEALARVTPRRPR